MSSVNRMSGSSIDNTVFKTAGFFWGLLRASQKEDLQSSAVLALEALGSSIIVHPDRISDGMHALSNGGQNERLPKFLVNIGVSSGGLSHFIRKQAPRYVTSFHLATGLKAFLTDAEIADIFYDMLVHQGLTKIPELRCSRSQLASVIEATSGYSDQLIPEDIVNVLVSALGSSGLHARAHDMRMTFGTPNSKELARIFSLVFGSVRNEEVEFVTLEGSSNCTIIASTFLWLNGDDVQLTVGDQTVIGVAQPKILINIPTSGETGNSWVVQEWRQGRALSKLIVTGVAISDKTSATPTKAAKKAISAQYALSDEKMAYVGQLATALVLAAVERGLVYGISGFAGAAPTECRIGNLWLEKEKIESGHPLLQTNFEKLCWILNFIEQRRAADAGEERHKHAEASTIEAAIYIASQSLYGSICSRFPKVRFFRTGSWTSICRAGVDLLYWVVWHEGLRECKDLPTPIADLRLLPESITLGSLRCSCIASLLPGVEVAGYGEISSGILTAAIETSDLAVASNGPGYIRRLGDDHNSPQGNLLRIQEGEDEIGSNRNASDAVDNTPFWLYPIDKNGFYTGIPSLSDINQLEVRPFESYKGRVLQIRTKLHQANTNRSTSVNWIHSIEAVAVATHLYNQTMPAFAEKQLALRWHEENVWGSVGVIAANEMAQHAPGTPLRYLARTFGSEELRFFFAGRGRLHKIYICHGNASVVKCIQQALDGEKKPGSNPKVFATGASRKIQPWMDSRLASQIIAPGWYIVL
ncbi:hypothetical protein QBC35DRAFT_518045 [Podospora australis]|uniref:Uncharacterized protein n=1 Tax=Podospora australis TaxID=1536484 RepID=A0AAN7AF96_9PEZI|nr:hypothetical protein QBC35DRAFT_518045 [Podospora australis]